MCRTRSHGTSVANPAAQEPTAASTASRTIVRIARHIGRARRWRRRVAWIWLRRKRRSAGAVTDMSGPPFHGAPQCLEHPGANRSDRTGAKGDDRVTRPRHLLHFVHDVVERARQVEAAAHM